MSTPIEEAINIGPLTGAELRSVGISSLEDLQEIGWEQVCRRWCEAFPERLHAMAAYALLGAEREINLLNLTKKERVAAKNLIQALKRERCGG